MAFGRQDKTPQEKTNDHKNKGIHQPSEVNDTKTPVKMATLDKVPASIINISINHFLKTNELAFLTQINRFFNQTLSKAIAQKKAEMQKNYNEAISRLFKNVDPMGKMIVQGQKAIEIGKLITQFLNKEHCEDHDQYSKLILAHAFDLDKNNREAILLGEYVEGDEWRQYFPYLMINQTQNGKDRLCVQGLKLNTYEVEYMAEIYCLYYSEKLNVQCGQRKGYGYISFDLDTFLKEVLPVILNLSPKPVLSNPLSAMLDKVQRNCCIS